MVAVGLALGAIALGVFSVATARASPGYSLAGRSIAAAALELVAGLGLVLVGIRSRQRRPGSRFGPLLVATGITWFLADWNNPGADSALVFSAGLVLFLMTPPLVAHSALAFPDGRLRGWAERAALAVAYAGSLLVIGLLPTLVFGPHALGCYQCPHNLLRLATDAHLYSSFARTGVRLGFVWSVLLVGLIGWRLLASTPARRRQTLPVLCPAAVYIGLVAADFAHSLNRGFVSNDTVDRRLWIAEAAALILLAIGVAWSWLRARRIRGSLAALVVELARSSAGGALRDALAESLGDPGLQLGYPLDDGQLVDSLGRPIHMVGELTPLMREGETVALLGHRPGLLDDAEVVREVERASRLALDNERLQAEVRAQLARLRASRSRIVEASDAERRRLERNLHDGAQQRLVALALTLRLAQLRLAHEADPDAAGRLERAEIELRAALAELRELARGIFPAVLAEEGLAAAIEALAEERDIRVSALPAERTDPAAEAAAYFIVSEGLRGSVGLAAVEATRRDGRLVVEVARRGLPEDVVELEDRVGALDGRVEVTREVGGRSTIHAEIPCAW